MFEFPGPDEVLNTEDDPLVSLPVEKGPYCPQVFPGKQLWRRPPAKAKGAIWLFPRHHNVLLEESTDKVS